MELLIPAGNLECALAALHYGADALYLGMQQFSARADAENFSLDDLELLLGFINASSGKIPKIYITINTLLREFELEKLVELLSKLRDFKIDALIIQDLGVYKLVKDYFPELAMHASTQMTIHNKDGLLQARNMGFERVVLARELTHNEVKELSATPGIETEVFIYGALCYAYSGLCLLSSAYLNKSGNRGECSYYCRNFFQVKKDEETLKRNYALMSMKDLSLSAEIDSLRKAGISSLKVEGRKKTPLYVAAVSNYFRKLLDNSFKPNEKEELEKHLKIIFSRETCSFHWKSFHQEGLTAPLALGPQGLEIGRISRIVENSFGEKRIRFQLQNHQLEKYDGIRIELPDKRSFAFSVADISVFRQGNAKEGKTVFVAKPGSTVEVPLPEKHPEISSDSKLFCTSSQVVKTFYDWDSVRESQRSKHSLSCKLTFTETELQLNALIKTAKRNLAEISLTYPLDSKPDTARNPEMLQQQAENSFAKLGNTPFELEKFSLKNPLNLFLPAAVLNQARRFFMDKLEEKLTLDQQETYTKFCQKIEEFSFPETEEEKDFWSIKIDRLYFLNMFSDLEFYQLDELIFDLSLYKYEEIIDDLQKLKKKLVSGKLRLALPAIMRSEIDQRDWLQEIKNFAKAGFTTWQISNLSALELLSSAGITAKDADISSDWQLYVTNTAAAAALQELSLSKVTLSPDDNIRNLETLLGKLSSFAEVIVYADIPLAISAVCTEICNSGHCSGKANCDFEELQLVSPKNDRLTAINRNCQSVYLNEQALNLSGNIAKLKQLNARRFRADFMWKNYAPSKVKEVWQQLIEDKVQADNWTANLRFR